MGITEVADDDSDIFFLMVNTACALWFGRPKEEVAEKWLLRELGMSRELVAMAIEKYREAQQSGHSNLPEGT